ncbi:GW dipeptide domain-containing protein [Paucilactobacillus suebicus]|uniref:GW dipeptide domain-containing protein n=1 Tax=Paucilactobacillus suebicus TaxID=152335 RepID=UPI0002490CC2|nr:GW dipeptide domain-containing protein [Paucilactobacillus suebicus]
MYKKNKAWVVAASTIATMILGGYIYNGEVHADTVSKSSTELNSSTSSSSETQTLSNTASSQSNVINYSSSTASDSNKLSSEANSSASKKYITSSVSESNSASSVSSSGNSTSSTATNALSSSDSTVTSDSVANNYSSVGQTQTQNESGTQPTAQTSSVSTSMSASDTSNNESVSSASAANDASSSDVNVITAPSDLSADEYDDWIANAKLEAELNYEQTGRAQEVIVNDSVVLKITIGSSSIPRVDAVDVSSYQSWMTQSDFNKLKSLGVKSVIVKVSEGTDYKNPYAKSEISMAEKAGLNVDVYHYATFASQSAAVAQAKYLVSVLNSFGISKDVLVFADMEDTSTYTSQIGSYLNSFWSTLSGSGYTNHGVYTYVSYEYAAQVVATVGKARTWMAQYPYTPTSSTKWNTSYGAWQFSSTAYLPGSSNAIDVSIDYTGLFLLKPVTYDTIKSTNAVSYYVLISENSRNDGLFVDGPYFTSAATNTFSGGTAKSYNGEWAKVTEEAVTSRATWVKVTFGDGKTYWMDKRGVTQEASFDAVTNKVTENYKAKISQSNRSDGLYTDGPYGTSANTISFSAGSAKQYNGQEVTVIAQENTKRATWVEIKLSNGKTYWMDKRGITGYDAIMSTTSVSYYVMISESTRSDGLFVDGPYDTSTETDTFSGGTAKSYNGEWAKVTEEAVTSRATWVKVTFGDGKTYWMDKRGVTQEASFDAVTNKVTENYKAKISQSNRSDGLYTDGPYGTSANTISFFRR